MGKLLSKDDILQAQDLPIERVSVPEWSGEVLVRGLTGAERDKFEASIVIRKGDKAEFNPDNMRAKLVALCVVDEQGNRLFSDKDVEFLGKKSAAALDRVFQVAQRLSGISPGAVEDLGKN